MKKSWTKRIVFMLALVMTLSMGVCASAKNAALKKGSTFTCGKLTYKVTSLNGKKGTVKVISAKKGAKEVNIPSTVSQNGLSLTVDAIGESAFKNCAKLQKVTTGKTLKTIGKNAFAGCKKLKKLDISKSKKLKKVGKNALKGASKVKVEVPETKDISFYTEQLGVASSKIIVTEKAEIPALKETETKAPATTQGTPTGSPASDSSSKTPQQTAPQAQVTPQPETTVPATEALKPETPQSQDSPATEKAPQPETKAPQAETPQTEAKAPQSETEAPKEEPLQTETAAPETEVPQTETTAPETEALKPETETPQTEATAPQTEAPKAETPQIQDTPAMDDAPGAETVQPQTQEEPKTTCSGGNHVFTAEWKQSKAATCAEWESLYRTCECGGSMESKLGAAPTGKHVYEHHKTEPTCEKEGSEWDVCKGCGQKINVTTLPAKGGHKFDKKVIERPSSCNSYGYGHYECSICGKRGDSFNIPAGKHAWVESRVAPTCTTYGYKVRTCSECGLDEEIPGSREAKLAHTFTEESTTPASCEADGQTVKRCSACGSQETIITGKRTGHSWGAPVTVWKSTCQQEGIVQYTCANCNASKEVTTPKSDHRWVLGEGRNGLDHCADCQTKFPYAE